MSVDVISGRMDEIDLHLIQLLVWDPRATYRELADALGLTVQATHRRMASLIEAQVILGFATSISAAFLEASSVVIWGRSAGLDREGAAKAFSGDARISAVLLGSGGMTYVYALLRRISDLDDLVGAVQKGAAISEARIGLELMKPLGTRPSTMAEAPLTDLDLRIVAAMARDARRPLAEIAKEIGVTAATVNRRLGRLLEMGALEFTTLLHPGFSGDIVAILQVDLRPGSDRQTLIGRLRAELGPAVEYYRTFSNLQDYLTCVAWTKTLKELEELTKTVAKDAAVQKVTPDIMFTGWYHPTWRDGIPFTAAGKKS
jgi:Lrp/AsnC family leucine-responsive transcriptional regulator